MIGINKKNNGFTLVESLVAISVLLIGVLGPLVLATRAISDGISTKNKVEASYLAQSAVELLKGARDLGSESFTWNSSFLDMGALKCGAINNPCAVVDSESDITISDCGGSPNPCDFGIFRRKIFIKEGLNPDYYKIIVEVTWSEKGILQKAYKLKYFLFP